MFPIQCQACKGTFHVAKITDALRCGCGSDDLDLVMEAADDPAGRPPPPTEDQIKNLRKNDKWYVVQRGTGTQSAGPFDTQGEAQGACKNSDDVATQLGKTSRQHTAADVATWYPSERPGVEVGHVIEADGIINNAGITWEEAQQKYPGIKKQVKDIPVTVDVDDAGNVTGPDWYVKGAKEAAALFNKRHYEHIADTLRSAPVDDETRGKLADHFTESMRGTNPNFQPGTFRERAVGDDYSPKTRRRVGKEAAVGSGPGYYILSNGVAVAGPFASTSLAHDALPGQHGNAVQWLGDKDRVKDLSETDAFPNPGGYDSSASDQEMGFAGGGTMGGIWGGGLGMWAKRYAKIREITRGIQETNPGLPRKEARRVAKDTVERFPGMVA